MKPALYYTLARSRWSPENAVVYIVTSEGPRGRINGRFLDGFPSHTIMSDCIGRFETQEQAEEALKSLKKIVTAFETAINEAERTLRELRYERDREISNLVSKLRRGEPC